MRPPWSGLIFIPRESIPWFFKEKAWIFAGADFRRIMEKHVEYTHIPISGSDIYQLKRGYYNEL